MITLGLDPHPDSHTVAALDKNSAAIRSITVPNTPDGLSQLYRFALPFRERRWAVESASNRFILPFVPKLLGQGEVVHHIPPNLTGQYRARLSRKKNDVVDAQNAARALQANPELPLFRPANANGSFKISPERSGVCPSNAKPTRWPCKHSTQVPLLALHWRR